jgi:SAM-dependent methyltransferase
LAQFEAFEATYDFEWDIDARVPFYLGLAREAGGAVAEFSCGTGRLLMPIARSGIEVWGVEAPGAMTARLGRRLMDEPEEARRFVKLVEADPAAADLGRDFPLVFVAFGGLQLYVDDNDLASFLATLARHVAPGGLAAFDLIRPDAAARAQRGLMRHAWTMERRRFRETVSRFESLAFEEGAGLMELTVFLDTVDETGQIARRVVQQKLRHIEEDGVATLLAEHGLVVEGLYGSAEGAPVDDSADRMFVVARKAAGAA